MPGSWQQNRMILLNPESTGEMKLHLETADGGMHYKNKVMQQELSSDKSI